MKKKKKNKMDDTSYDIEIKYSDDFLDEDDDNDDEFTNEEKRKPSIFRKIFFSLILIIALTIIYSRYIATSGLTIKEYPIESDSIAESINGFKIAHFSDVHYGRVIKLDELKNLVKEINLTKPDIVVFTGDLVDKTKKLSDNDINNIITELSKINSKYGKYYVTGEHDVELDKYYEIMDSAGFNNLDNKFDIIYKDINSSILITGLSVKPDESFIDKVINENKVNYKINIMHYPDEFDNIKKYNYDLVLAGHSHNGQIALPVYGAVITPENAKEYYKPYYKIDNTLFYISSGVGTTKFDYRFLNKPSFNLYRILKK